MPSSARRFEKRPSLDNLVERVDAQRPGEITGDTIPTGFGSLDKLLGGGLRLRGLPLSLLPLAGEDFETAFARLDPLRQVGLVIVDYLQLVPPPKARTTQDEDTALVLRHLKALALARQVALLVVAQLPTFQAERADPRPTLDDYGVLGAAKQHADVILSIFREEMYRPGGGVEGATELIVAKNRNGPTGFVDLYFYRRWMRFEDMLDPDR